MSGLVTGIIASLIATGLGFLIARSVRKTGKIHCSLFTCFKDFPVEAGNRSEFPFGGPGVKFLKISVPHQPPMLISGGNLERKEGTKFEIQVTRTARRLVVAGWGCVRSKQKSFRGSLSDSEQIGCIEFRDKNKRVLKCGEIRLPGYSGQLAEEGLVLKLADASPFLSGDPDEAAVKARGLLSRKKLSCNPESRKFWPFANVWVGEVLLPMGTRRVVLIAEPGSYSLVHVRTVHRPWIIEKIVRSISLKSTTKVLSNEYERWCKGEILAARELKEYLPENRGERSERLSKAAMHLVNAGYLLEGAKRNEKLEEAADTFFDAAYNLEEHDRWKACEYNVNGFVCLIQSESPRIFQFVEKVNAKLEELAVEMGQRRESGVGFSFDPIFIKLRHHIGWFYLECAQSAPSRPEKINWLKKTDKDFVEMAKNTLDFGYMLSEPLLRFLQERCLILERVYHELGIRREGPESLKSIRIRIDTLLTQIIGKKGQI